MRLPGFRKGKAPPSLVIQRLGFGPVFEEAIRESLPEWYEQARARLRRQPDRRPRDRDHLGAGGGGRAARLQVRGRRSGRRRSSASTRASRSARPSPRCPTTSSTARSSGSARASPAGAGRARGRRGRRPADRLRGTIDGEPFEGGEADDHLLELGSGRFIEGFEEQLTGAEPESDHEVEVTFPEDYQAEHLAGKDAVFKVKVKEVREKILPELDDDFASDASEFDTLEELRADIREKLARGRRTADRGGLPHRRRSTPPSTPPRSRSPTRSSPPAPTERWERIERQLAGRGIDPNTFLQMQGRTREELIEESKPDAERELQREAVLDRDRRGGGDRGLRRGDGRGARAHRRARTDDAGEAARAAAPRGPRRPGPRGPARPQGDRRRRRLGEADPDGDRPRRARSSGRRRTSASRPARSGPPGD